jgi:hypothetical protein
MVGLHRPIYLCTEAIQVAIKVLKFQKDGTLWDASNERVGVLRAFLEPLG